jgi:hypothetical protein
MGDRKLIHLLFVALVFSLVSPEAKCELLLALEPQNPAVGEEVFVHVTSGAVPQCFPPVAIVSIAGQAISVRLSVTDSCANDNFVTERRYSLGSFSAGIYAMETEFCALNPPPFPNDCNVISRMTFDVGGAVNAASVPVNGARAMLWLFFSMVVASAVFFRRVSRK